jgi:hypothetical protein
MLRGRSGKDKGMVVAVVLAALLAALACSACSGSQAGLDSAEAARAAVDQRIAGVWRLTSYVPAQSLSPAMLFGLSDKIVVRFERGLIRSETTSLTFERQYRVTAAQGDTFRIIIKDDQGVEYESICQFDEGGRIHFQTITAPWTGRGVLEREGNALAFPY